MAFTDILDALLLPVFNRVYEFLKLDVTGTDDAVQHSSLRRAYFNLLLSIAQGGMPHVLYSNTNKPHLETILQSITHYVAAPDTAPIDQRFGFIALSKFRDLWVDPIVPAATKPKANGVAGGKTAAPVEPSPVPGFEQFLYEHAVKVCFEVPMRPTFDFDDAACVQVLGEIATFLKGLQLKRGDEFVAFMTSSLFPSLQCPPDAANAFLHALQTAPEFVPRICSSSFKLRADGCYGACAVGSNSRSL